MPTSSDTWERYGPSAPGGCAAGLVVVLLLVLVILIHIAGPEPLAAVLRPMVGVLLVMAAVGGALHGVPVTCPIEVSATGLHGHSRPHPNGR
jgi:hypothetical protein